MPNWTPGGERLLRAVSYREQSTRRVKIPQPWMALNMYPATRIIARHSATRTLALVMSGIALVACGSDDRAKPGTKISLTFTGKSKSEYFFVLENPTSQSIYFRGTKWLWFAPTPVDTGFDCKNTKTGEGMVGGFRFLTPLPAVKTLHPSRFRLEKRLGFGWTVSILLDIKATISIFLATKARLVNYTCSYGILTCSNLAARLSNRRFFNLSRYYSWH